MDLMKAVTTKRINLVFLQTLVLSFWRRLIKIEPTADDQGPIQWMKDKTLPGMFFYI